MKTNIDKKETRLEILKRDSRTWDKKKTFESSKFGQVKFGQVKFGQVKFD